MQPVSNRVSTTIGQDRWLDSGRHYRDLATREAALRYVAAWVWRYTGQIAEEMEEHILATSIGGFTTALGLEIDAGTGG